MQIQTRTKQNQVEALGQLIPFTNSFLATMWNCKAAFLQLLGELRLQRVHHFTYSAITMLSGNLRHDYI